MPTGRIGFVLAAVAASLGVAATGCGGGARDRAGGTIGAKTVVLTLASHDNGAEVRAWADAVARLR